MRLLPALLLLLATACLANKDTLQWPYPQTSDNTLKILENSGYTTGYSECRRSALWVSYPLETKRYKKWPKQRPYFKEDPRVNSHVTPDDYWFSGYTRGHLAPGYAVWSVSGPEARRQTYLMSNILPQRKNLNQKLWQRLEEVATTYFTRYFDTITVYTGPVYSQPAKYLDSGLAVPEAFYKIFSGYKNDKLLSLGFIMPQNVHGKESLNDYVVSIDKIEQQTGIDFFHWLDDSEENQLELTVRSKPWNLKTLSDLPGRY